MKALFLLPAMCLLLACAGRQPQSLEVSPEEVIVVGRIHAYERGQEVTPDIQLLFNEPVATFYRALTPRDSGHFVLRLPRGSNWIHRLEYKGRYVIFPKDYAVLNLPDSGKLHYVGDIRIVFSQEMLERPTGAPLSPEGALGYLARSLQGASDFIPVVFEVSQDSAAARAFVRRTYGIDGRWTYAPLETRDGPQVESEIVDEGEEFE